MSRVVEASSYLALFVPHYIHLQQCQLKNYLLLFGPKKERRRRIKAYGRTLPTALGRAHNVISDDELKVLSSVPSHELVSRHVHKLVHVLGESLHLTTDYLTMEEKVVMANSRVEAIEAESSRLRKDLIEAMYQANEAETKLKEVF